MILPSLSLTCPSCLSFRDVSSNPLTVSFGAPAKSMHHYRLHRYENYLHKRSVPPYFLLTFQTLLVSSLSLLLLLLLLKIQLKKCLKW